MVLKNKFNLFALIMCFLLVGFSSCKEDNKLIIDDEKDTITIDDVLLAQTVNDVLSFRMTDGDDILVHSSVITFADNKVVKWSNPVLEQTFDGILDILADNVSVTNAEGTKVASVDVKVVSNKVEVSFLKVGGNYDYMSAAKFNLKVDAQIKLGVTQEELEAVRETGFSTQSVFHIEGETKQAKSNLVTVYPPNADEPDPIAKGDPRNEEYKYRLNVVYFVPSDVVENAGYKERISNILFHHQLFIMKWMKHWGYEEKSYGLDVDDAGLVNIITIKALGKRADYPYEGSSGKMKAEVTKYYADNQLEFLSEHTLIITAVNEDLANGVKVPSVPFYGSGRFCFALDYPGMSQEAMGLGTEPSHVATVWIGGMLHELGHGMNLPHVGPTYTHLNDPNFGTPLMGKGNRTYGEAPTFLQETSAAILNNSQITSFVEKTFYGTTTSSISISEVIINGSQCTVKGKFEASLPVTNVIVRFHDADQTHLGAAEGYTSVGFYLKPNADKTFEKTIDIADLKVNPFNYKVGATILMENGMSKSTSYSIIYRQENNTLVKVNLGKNWIGTASHAMPKDAVDNNEPANLFDGQTTTCLALVKPGSTYGGVTVPAGDQVFVTIDMLEQMSFNTVVLSFRVDDTRDWFRANKVSFYGSNDGTTFEPIKEANTLDVTKPTATVSLGKVAQYRYLKMTYDAWHATASTMQFSELDVQNK